MTSTGKLKERKTSFRFTPEGTHFIKQKLLEDEHLPRLGATISRYVKSTLIPAFQAKFGSAPKGRSMLDHCRMIEGI
jgi:hypothetical protein